MQIDIDWTDNESFSISGNSRRYDWSGDLRTLRMCHRSTARHYRYSDDILDTAKTHDNTLVDKGDNPIDNTKNNGEVDNGSTLNNDNNRKTYDNLSGKTT